MQIDTSFEVPVPVDQAWDVLLDVEGIAPCMPGATLEGRDGDAYKGKVKLKVGPIQAQYAGTAEITEADQDAGRLTLAARGREQRGMGTADATVVATLHEVDGSTTRVDVATTLNITGKAAQFGRGVMQDVARKLVGQFADNLAALLAGRQDAGAAEAPGEPAAGSPAPAPSEAGAGEAGASEAGASGSAASSEGGTSGAGAAGAAASPPPRPAPAAAPETSLNVLSLLASSPRVWAGLAVIVVILVLLGILIF